MGIVVITIISLFLGVILSITHYYLNNQNQNVQEVEKMLPGFNCNACGLGTCKGMAEKALINADNLLKCRFLKEQQLEDIKEYIKTKS